MDSGNHYEPWPFDKWWSEFGKMLLPCRATVLNEDTLKRIAESAFTFSERQQKELSRIKSGA